MSSDEKFAVKIFVLDDERLIRMTICARMRTAGYEAVSVVSVDEAVATLKKSHRGFSAIVGGDLYAAMPIGPNRMLFVLGDIQGHGTNATLVIIAVQAFQRQRFGSLNETIFPIPQQVNKEYK